MKRLMTVLLLLLVQTSAWATLPFTDNFTGTAGALSTPYTIWRGAGFEPFLNGSGQCGGGGGGTYDPVYNSVETFGNAQSAEVQITSNGGTSGVGFTLITNAQGAYASGAYYDAYVENGGGVGIEKTIGGTTVGLATGAGTASASDVFKFTHNGSGVLTLFKNGVSILTFTDTGTVITGGAAGFGPYGTPTTDILFEYLKVDGAPSGGSTAGAVFMNHYRNQTVH